MYLALKAVQWFTICGTCPPLGLSIGWIETQLPSMKRSIEIIWTAFKISNNSIHMNTEAIPYLSEF